MKWKRNMEVETNIKNNIQQHLFENDRDLLQNKLYNYRNVLNANLDFHGMSTNYGSHNFHAFAAKFPPQIPHIFIESLTSESDIVLDPMVGSGTTLVEAILLGRNAIGIDLDPLAQLICNIKTAKISQNGAQKTLSDILDFVNFRIDQEETKRWMKSNFDEKTKEFIDYWFEKKTQLELASLICSIEKVVIDESMKKFFLGIFSSIIITKSGGVSKALDLAHTRPHRDLKKKPKNAIQQFRNKAEKSIKTFNIIENARGKAEVIPGDSRNIPIDDDSIDFIITSPPYANAIDYMRAHKFSLVWLGWPIECLTALRSKYIGNEKLRNLNCKIPSFTNSWCEEIRDKDTKKAKILVQYFSDMSLTISEMYRVLKNGNPAVVVIGPSTMRGTEIPTHLCLKEIGEEIGFKCLGVTERKLERNKRMMPISHKSNMNGIENRLHREYILGFWKL